MKMNRLFRKGILSGILFLSISFFPHVADAATNYVYQTREDILSEIGVEVDEGVLLTEQASVETAALEEAGPLYIDEQIPVSSTDVMESLPQTTNPGGNSVTEKLASMTLEEKIAQMFFVYPETLNINTYADDETRSIFSGYPVGGVIYFEQNLSSQDQVIAANSSLDSISRERIGLPIFLSTDEEGGIVRRLSGRIIDTYIGNMNDVTSDDEAYSLSSTIASYMKTLGFNTNFAPVSDVWSNPQNSVIGVRSFGNDAMLVSGRVQNAVAAYEQYQIQCTLKHFPGHGDTYADSHQGYASSGKTFEEMQNCELLPFRSGINAGCSFVMVGHISYPNITGDVPATLSSYWVTDVLKNQMGFQGIAITDAMNMGAITNNYSSGEAVIMAVNAGMDMILCPLDFHSDYQSLLQAAYDGRVSMDRINDAVSRILTVKLNKMS